jgi:protoporphyrinogen oxidase
MTKSPVVILGAGPAGLTAAYELCRLGVPSIVLEQDSLVGGLARTVEHNGYRFDIGGHRFFTKVPLIEKIWKEVLGDDLLVRPRLSRIYYRGKFFKYPLEPLDALKGLGLAETLRCLASYGRAHLAPRSPEDDLETWVSNRFGQRLYEIFFKGYTEKVWGIPCRQIRSEWAAQRIRGLSLSALIWDAVALRRRDCAPIKTLIREFYYPRLGPGMMWSRMRELVEQQGARVVLNAPVEEIVRDDRRITAVRAGGRLYSGNHFISSIPIRELIERLSPAAPKSLRRASRDFHYRDFITVALIVRGTDLFPDNWIYVHDAAVSVGRIQNYSNWSPDMTPDAGATCLGLEYFCQQGDSLWSKPDAELVALAVGELAHLKLAPADAVIDAKVVRMPKAYPIYDGSYRRGLSAVRQFLTTVSNLQLVGRNGMHRYNNQDHSMLTAILAARNVMGASNDLWELNIDAGYQEDGASLSAQDMEALEAAQPRTPGVVSVA